MNVRRAGQVAKPLVNQIGKFLDERDHATPALLFGSFDELTELWEMGDVSGGCDKLEVVLAQFVCSRIEVGERQRFVGNLRKVVGQHDRFRLDPQPPMFLKDIELVHGVSVRIAVSRAVGMWRTGNAERKATLPLVVNRPQAQLIIAFRDGTVVSKL